MWPNDVQLLWSGEGGPSWNEDVRLLFDRHKAIEGGTLTLRNTSKFQIAAMNTKMRNHIEEVANSLVTRAKFACETKNRDISTILVR